MQLATKISELAGNKQDEELKAQEEQRASEISRVKNAREEHESQDMFYPTQDDTNIAESEENTPTNPFLAAKLRKENTYSANPRLQSSNSFNSPDFGDNRNPFKKSNLTPQRFVKYIYIVYMA